MRLQGWIRMLITLMVTVLLVPALGYVSVMNANPQAQAFSASIQPLGGVVQHQTNSSGWQPVSKVTLLQSGDKLRTGAEGAAEVSTVTGIKVTVFPSTQIELQTLAMNTGNSGGQHFTMNQAVGTTYVSIDQKLKAEDNIEFFTPSGRMVIHGTRFYIFVGVSGRSTVIGEDSVVTVEDFQKQRFDTGPDNITFLDLGDLSDKANALCTVAFLQNSKGRLVTALSSATDRKALLEFLKDFLRVDVNDLKVKFIAGLIGLPDTSKPEELIAALDKFDKPLDLKDVLKQIRAYLAADLNRVSGKPMATADKFDKASCGNNFCETQLRGESILSCAADCFPHAGAIQACIKSVHGLFNPPNPPGGNGGNPPINTPKPSGVG